MGRFNAAQVPPVTTDAPAPKIAVLPAPAAQATKAAKPKLDFGGLKTKASAPKSGTDYPVLPDPEGKLAEIAVAFLEEQEREEAAKGAKESAHFELVQAARPFYFQFNAGRPDVPSSVAVQSPKGEVRVTFKDKYKKLSDVQFEAVGNVVGNNLAEQYFSQTFKFTIDSDKIPAAVMQDVIDRVTEMASSLGIADAVMVDTCYQPSAEWHLARFRQLSAVQNLQLEQLIDPEKGFAQVAVGPVRGRK